MQKWVRNVEQSINLLNRKMKIAATFHDFYVQGYPKEIYLSGHKTNGIMHEDSFFDSEGLVL